jgi:uncharacterized protein
MTRARLLMILACCAGVAIVWSASAELGPAVRAWTAFLLILFPALLVMQAGRLRDIETIPRSALYTSSIVSLWAIAVMTWAVTRLSHVDLMAIGMRPLPWLTAVGWTAALTLGGIAVIQASDALGLRESEVTRQLLPATSSERALFAGVALTAGICEELVFRGFLLMALTLATGSIPLAVLLVSFAFGVVHAYQDPAGVGRAALLGLVLAIPVITTGSIYPSMAAHFIIDIIGGYWLGPRMLKNE